MSTVLERVLARIANDESTPSAAVAALARSARERLLQGGLPHPRLETWRYSSLRALERLPWAEPNGGDFATDGLLGSLGAAAEVWWNGVRRAVGDGHAGHVRRRIVEDATVRASFYDTDAVDPGQAFVEALRAAIADGAWWSIPSGVDARQLRYLACGADAGVYWQAQHGLRLEAGARACWVTHHFGAAARALGNQRLRIELGPGAELTWIHLQDLGPEAHLIESIRCVLADRARLDAVVVNLGAAWVHQRLEIELVGAEARLAIDGLTAVDGRRHLDTQLSINHRGVEQHSRCRWRALATERARAVLGGRIEIHPGAVRTDAALRAHNLLLSDRAEIDCRPELEIHADDVQAAHGASVGRLDPDALFYLQARGLDPSAARRMLTAAFAGVALEHVTPAALQEELRARLATQVGRWA